MEDGIYSITIFKTICYYMYDKGLPYFADYSSKKGHHWQLTVMDPQREKLLNMLSDNSKLGAELIYTRGQEEIAKKVGKI